MKNGNAVELAIALMKKHGLRNWKLLLGSSKSNHGECDFNTRTIILSRNFVQKSTFWEVRDTILHEIAHALRGNHYHDDKWKAVAESVGALPLRVATKVGRRHGKRKT